MTTEPEEDKELAAEVKELRVLSAKVGPLIDVLRAATGKLLAKSAAPVARSALPTPTPVAIPPLPPPQSQATQPSSDRPADPVARPAVVPPPVVHQPPLRPPVVAQQAAPPAPRPTPLPPTPIVKTTRGSAPPPVPNPVARPAERDVYRPPQAHQRPDPVAAVIRPAVLGTHPAQPAASPQVYGFADKKDRVEAGDRYGVMAPVRRPTDPVPPAERLQSGSVSIFTKPIPVLIAGPKTLEVRIAGGGGKTEDKPKDDATGQKKGFWGGFRGSVVKGAKEAFNRSRVGRATEPVRRGVRQAFTGDTPAERGAGLATAAGGTVTALNELRKAAMGATEQQLATIRHLAEISGPMAAIKAFVDINQLQRDIRMGQAMSGSARGLAEAENRRRDAAEPVEVALGNATNKVLTFLSDNLLVPVLEVMNNGIELLKMIPGVGDLVGDEEKKKKQKAGESAVNSAIQGVAEQAERDRKNIQDILDRVRANDRKQR